LKLRSCKLDGKEKEYVTFIAVLATVEDSIGYRVWPPSELNATPEKTKIIRTDSFMNKFTGIHTKPHTLTEYITSEFCIHSQFISYPNRKHYPQNYWVLDSVHHPVF
jgi:hypothetical protein